MLALLTAIAEQRFEDPIPMCGVYLRLADDVGFIERVGAGVLARWVLTERGRDVLALLQGDA